MKDIFKYFAIAVCVSISLLACSGENKPTTNELKTAYIQSIPNHVELKNFSIQAMQNYGTVDEPIYGSQFKATLITLVNLYKKVKSKKDVAFVRLVTEKGKQIEIFGKTTSRRFQGIWMHCIDTDGAPIAKLGVPFNKMSASRVVVQGSDEEMNSILEKNEKYKSTKDLLQVLH